MDEPRGGTGRTDWVRWHEAYDDPGSSLSQRLGVVRRLVGQALELVPSEAPTVLSLCAGDGRDLLPALGGRSAGPACRAVLVEQDPLLAEAARLTAGDLGLGGVEIRCADAASPEVWSDVVPVDVLLLCGVFGNIAVAEVDALVAVVPHLLRAGGCVVWTRGRTDPDLRPHVRATVTAAGFEEVAYEGEPASYGVGLDRLADPPPEPREVPTDRLFTFRR